MNKVKTRELHSHNFKQEFIIYNDEEGSIRTNEFDCTLSNDKSGTHLLFIKGDEHIMITLEQIFSKLGIEVEVDE